MLTNQIQMFPINVKNLAKMTKTGFSASHRLRNAAKALNQFVSKSKTVSKKTVPMVMIWH